MTDFRIIKLSSGEFIPQTQEDGSWVGIEKKFEYFDNAVRKYELWNSIEYAIKNCKVTTEDKAEKIINDYYDWQRAKKHKVDYETVKTIKKPDL